MDKSLGAHGGFVAAHSIISYSSCASSTYLPLTYQENCRAKLLARAPAGLCGGRAADTRLQRLPRRFYRIRHQHRDGHWTDAAGDRRDCARLSRDFAKCDIAYQAVTALVRWIFDAINAHVDDDGAFAHVIGFQEFRAPNCCHNNVG